jgi:hypothetical protein
VNLWEGVFNYNNMNHKLLLPELNTYGYSFDSLLEESVNGLDYLSNTILEQKLYSHAMAPSSSKRTECETLQDVISILSGLIESIQSVYPEIKILENVKKVRQEKHGAMGTKYTLTMVYDLGNHNPEYKIIPFLVKGIKIPSL